MSDAESNGQSGHSKGPTLKMKASNDSGGGMPSRKNKRKAKKKSLDTLRRDQKLRRRHKFATMTVQERDQYRAIEAQRRRERRISEGDEKKTERRERAAKRHDVVKTKAKADRERELQRLQDGTATKVDAQIARRRKRNAEHMRKVRANMTEEELNIQRAKQAKRMQVLRAAAKLKQNAEKGSQHEQGSKKPHRKKTKDGFGDSLADIFTHLKLKKKTKGGMMPSGQEGETLGTVPSSESDTSESNQSEMTLAVEVLLRENLAEPMETKTEEPKAGSSGITSTKRKFSGSVIKSDEATPKSSKSEIKTFTEVEEKVSPVNPHKLKTGHDRYIKEGKKRSRKRTGSSTGCNGSSDTKFIWN